MNNKIDINKKEIEKQNEYIQKVADLNKDKNLKYNIQTMGCQLNENDSEKLSGMLSQMGYSQTDNQKEADIIIFNTCCVRENAEETVFGRLGETKKIKSNNGTIIAIGGCMTQEPHIVQKIKKSYFFVDIVFGTHTLHKFPEDLYEVLIENKKVKDVIDIDGEIYEGLPVKREDKTKASVTIMYGCDNYCTYCIVPYVRGRERSRLPEDILKEVKELVNEGYKEITLLGQNVNSYKGMEDYNFSNLLNDVAKIEGLERLKFISPHPKDFKDDVIEAIANNSNIARLIHLPLQSGSSNVLKLMNRKYTKEQFLNLVDKMREKIPNVAFSTDIIVGFPGETELDFEETLDVVEKVKFEQVFMFIYSKRVGTPAAKMKNQVPEEVKHARFNKLKQLVEKQITLDNQKYIGTIQKIIVEGKSKNNENMLTGRTTTNKVVNFEGDESLTGKVIDIKIVSEHMWYLKGEII